ncbi:helix-turn-helix domain-containing protein [Sulfitobacter sp. S223]|uniref:helix-turn-helix domain-containing protein n=1 Tax=Sulfitobacter sp. S223 TaxID=2867023 RepID=UPI0021A85D37|nr:helix-turn-helix transcriptional regulator [Sulfitobacter sp. S223]UWR27372.1 helix-turn-helix domain-containing protein [Sulfitobacter sp. S223]
MAGTVHTEAYSKLLKALLEVRREAGLSQAQLAKKLGKPPSFVGKYEVGERRLDVIELLFILRVCERESYNFIKFIESQLPDRL